MCGTEMYLSLFLFWFEYVCNLLSYMQCVGCVVWLYLDSVVGFLVLTALFMKSAIFLAMTSCGLLKDN
jgi:hypothetical protein